MLRRRFCLGVVAVLTGSAGCQDRDATPIPETAVDPETDAGDTPTIRVEDGDPEPGTVTDSGLESYLPDGTGEWKFRGVRDRTPDWSPLGATDGIIGQYRGPDGAAYEFLVMDTQPSYTEGTARSLACAGWQVAVVVDGHAIAASTGTEQRTFTPEVPPTMTQSPVPGTEDRVRELLALSPRLGTADIDENRVHC